MKLHDDPEIPQLEEVLENHTTPTSFSMSPSRLGRRRGYFIGKDAAHQTKTLKLGERSPPADGGRDPSLLHGPKAIERGRSPPPLTGGKETLITS
jgi:hypothetical protein